MIPLARESGVACWNFQKLNDPIMSPCLIFVKIIIIECIHQLLGTGNREEWQRLIKSILFNNHMTISLQHKHILHNKSKT